MIETGFNWEAARFWLEGFGVLFAVVVAVASAGYTWYRTRKSDNDRRIDHISASLTRQLEDFHHKNEHEHDKLHLRQDSFSELAAKTAGRVDVLEERMQGLPRHGDLRRIWEKLDQHNGLISTMSGQLEAQTNLLREINTYLMNRGRDDA